MTMKVETKSATLMLRIRPSIKAMAGRRAAQQDRSLASYIEKLIARDAHTAEKVGKRR
jgi:predicted HicB family RNase H-like nuclease